MKQWLAYQVTAQGPLCCNIFSTGRSCTAILKPKAAYVTDFRRLLQVSDDRLEARQWLVGDMCSGADLSFVSLHSRLGFIVREDVPDIEKEFCSVDARYKRMLEREGVKKVTEEQDESF